MNSEIKPVSKKLQVKSTSPETAKEEIKGVKINKTNNETPITEPTPTVDNENTSKHVVNKPQPRRKHKSKQSTCTGDCANCTSCTDQVAVNGTDLPEDVVSVDATNENDEYISPQISQGESTNKIVTKKDTIWQKIVKWIKNILSKIFA